MSLSVPLLFSLCFIYFSAYFCVLEAAPTPPVLPTQYSVFMNLTANPWHDLVQVYYSWDNNTPQQRADHTNFLGKNQVVLLYFQNNQVYHVDKVSEACCTIFAGNQIASPNWLNGALYSGQTEFNGNTADKWFQRSYLWVDDSNNHDPFYWSWDNGMVVAEFTEFNQGDQPSNIFVLPKTCSTPTSCPLVIPLAYAGIWL